MAVGGYLKLFRKIDNWEWIDDIDVTYVFIRLLLKANYKEKIWHGTTIKRGQFLTSRRTLAKDMNLSEQRLKTVLKKLESTNEIEITATHQATLITVVNYEFYQSETEKATHDQPTINPVSNPQPTQFSTHEPTHAENGENIENSEFYQSETEKATHQTTHQSKENQPTDVSKINPNIRNNNIKNNILLNYTKLNILFNYLIYKEQKFEKLKEDEREGIINILKKLELYTPSTDCIPEEKILELKLQYWAITELYLSPYKVYINKLNRVNFLFRFLKVKKYIDYKNISNDEELKHFMGYFIKSIREELKEKWESREPNY